MPLIKFVDMFSGIGGFREGLTRAGGFECVGHCEIDKYANRSYNALFDTKGEWFIEDARKADPGTMPDFQLLCGGFPCQTFSIAGSRKGFGDPRGTLFFELARLAEARKPPYLLFENVVGLINHDHCRTFATILNTLDRLGYGVEWQCLNSKDFGVPQSRNRVYIIGYLDERCRGNVGCLPGVFRYPNPQNRIHVTEKPLQLMRDVVQICEPGGRILDPFAGAGTTVLAAAQEGYEAVGIEMSDAYFRRSTERLKTALESEVNQN